EAIDASGELDGIKFRDAAGLGEAMRDNPATTSCLVDSVYRYAVGRNPMREENEWLRYLEKGFSSDGYRLPELLKRIAVSEAFYRSDAAGVTNAQVQKSVDSSNRSQETESCAW